MSKQWNRLRCRRRMNRNGEIGAHWSFYYFLYVINFGWQVNHALGIPNAAEILDIVGLEYWFGPINNETCMRWVLIDQQSWSYLVHQTLPMGILWLILNIFYLSLSFLRGLLALFLFNPRKVKYKFLYK